jgi:hypothetical protein
MESIVSSSNSRRAQRRWVAVVPYVVLLAGAFCTFGHAVDDSYITFRFAANLVHGHGPVFNVGERVEGFSSPLHMLLSALLIALSPSPDILFVAKLASLAFGLLTVWQMRRLARHCGLRAWQIVFAQALAALNVNFCIASVNALETSLYAFLVVVSCNVFLDELRRGRGYASAYWLFATLLARPDTLLIFGTLFLVRAYFDWRSGHAPFRTLRWAAGFVVPMLLLMAARQIYFGYPLPNTYYAKNVTIRYGLEYGLPYLLHPLVPFNRRLEHWEALREFFAGHAVLVDLLWVATAPVFWGLAAIGIPRACRRRRAAGLVCVAVVAAETSFVLKCGGDWMTGWRFMAATLPFFAVLQCYGVLTLGSTLRKRGWSLGKGDSQKNKDAGLRRRRMRFAVPALVLFFWVAAAGLSPHVSWRASGYSTRGEAIMQGDEDQNGPWEVLVANYIRDRLTNCRFVAYSEMGYACYTNLDKRFLDVHGLTETELAHMPAEFKQRTGFCDFQWRNPSRPLYRYMKERRPDAIIVSAQLNAGSMTGPVLETWLPYDIVGPAEYRLKTSTAQRKQVALVYLEQSLMAAGGMRSVEHDASSDGMPLSP